MQVATIVPQNYLHLIEEDKYLMALGHLVEAPGMDKYTEFFKHRAKEEDVFIIMDNGVIEGDPRSIEELMRKAETIGANELVLPDVFCDMTPTLRAVDQATRFIASMDSEDTIDSLGFMAVPQGKTLEQWLSCAVVLLNNPLISCLGIPKVLVKLAGRDGRYRAIAELLDRVGELNVDLHLLGCWQSPLEVSIISKLINQGDLVNIRGVDSAIPYVYARAGMKINDSDRPDSKAIDFKQGAIDNEMLLATNIHMWRDCVDMDPDKQIHFI